MTLNTQELISLIKGRRTIQSFENNPIDEKVLAQIVEAAIWAPNHKLTFPLSLWRLGTEIREKMIALAIGEEKQAKLRDQLFSVGEILALGLNRSSNPFREREDYATVACAVQNMSLVAHSLGLGSKWGTGALTRENSTYSVMGIDPEKIEIVGFFYLGKPAKIPGPVARPLSTEYFHHLS